MTTTTTICSLCHHSLATNELRAHRERETREIVEYAVNLIKSRHPEWVESDPTCQMCWDYYQNLLTT